MGFNSAFKGLMEVYPAIAELFHADRRTDSKAKLIVAFRNFMRIN